MTHAVKNPDGVRAPSAHYSHSVEVSAGERLLFVAGQIGVAPNGSVADGIEAQSEQVFRNLETVLSASGFTVADVVSMRVFLVNRDDRPGFSAVRERHLGGHRPASTLVFCSGLASPNILVEVEAVAAKP